MRDKDLVGKTVVSMADGARVGTVKDLVFHELDLVSLVVRGEHGEGLLPYKSLGTNGPDAITIESYTLVDWNAGRTLEPDNKNTHELSKLAVVDSHGNMLGHMHGLTMDDGGHVQDIAVRTEGIFGIGAHEAVIPASRVRAVGADLITVDTAP
jgi:sporulation protein YlmC with PRC-barrel domain